PQMRQIDRQQGGQCGYGEVNQHRMQRMPGDRGAAVNGVSVVGHSALQWLTKNRPMRNDGLCNRPLRNVGEATQVVFQRPVKWTTLALSVPCLTACGGPLSTLRSEERRVANHR